MTQDMTLKEEIEKLFAGQTSEIIMEIAGVKTMKAQVLELVKSYQEAEDARKKAWAKRDIDAEIHANPKKFAWLGKSERRHIDFDNGFQFAVNELEGKREGEEK